MGIGQSNRLEEALDKATLGYEIGRRTGDRDLETFALSCRGLMLVYLGRIDEGLAALDEATVVAMAGELAPDVAGGVCCTAIGTCAILGDWSRATAWTEAQDRWCRREHINGFPGMCRLYRAEAKRVHGDWLEAEAEARRATDELAGFIPAAVGLAHYEVGVLRLRRGDLPAAEDALIRAHAFNRDPEPARSLLRLAQGRVEDATESILSSARRAADNDVVDGPAGEPDLPNLAAAGAGGDRPRGRGRRTCSTRGGCPGGAGRAVPDADRDGLDRRRDRCGPRGRGRRCGRTGVPAQGHRPVVADRRAIRGESGTTLRSAGHTSPTARLTERLSRSAPRWPASSGLAPRSTSAPPRPRLQRFRRARRRVHDRPNVGPTGRSSSRTSSTRRSSRSCSGIPRGTTCFDGTIRPSGPSPPNTVAKTLRPSATASSLPSKPSTRRSRPLSPSSGDSRSSDGITDSLLP